MTQVMNLPDRKLFLKTAEEQWSRAGTNRKPVSLILVSIDNFRECGGAAADICLRMVAETIVANTDKTACVVGLVRDHQFAILCGAAEIQDASRVANQIRKDVESLQLKPTADGGPLTVSSCVVTRVPKANQFVEALLIAADRGLREAIRYGGNQVAVVKPTGKP